MAKSQKFGNISNLHESFLGRRTEMHASARKSLELFGTKNLYHELNVFSCCNLTKVNTQTSCYFFGNLNFGERSCENRE